MSFSNKKVAILGATSHIAKGLISNFSITGKKYELFLFARLPERVKDFLKSIQYEKDIHLRGFEEFENEKYDVVINCIGISSTVDFKDKVPSYFRLTETFDNLVLDYIENHPDTLYINFNSGAVYGTYFSEPVSESTFTRWDINNITESDFYGIAKLNSEAKHRALKHLKIVDLRIFSYFSRFINLESKFLLSEIISCLKDNKEFITDSNNIIRDYIHPKDLFLLMEKCIAKKNINDVFDTYSLKPVTKFEILDFFAADYRLKYKVRNDLKISAVTGSKNNYYSNNKRAGAIGYIPKFNSLDCIVQESNKILGACNL